MRRDLTETWLRALYSAVLYVLTPATVYHLIWRGFRVPGYFQRWGERYAAWSGAPHDVDVWVHAVSVGEVNAAAPVVDALRRDHPHLKLLITTITPTGSDRVRALWGDAVLHVYAPYDLPGAVGRFLAHFQPGVALVMETELWPNLLLGCRDRGIRSYILNARLSARSLRGYRVLAPLIRRVVASVHRIGAQSVADGKRFVRLGASPEAIVDTGNLKFDIAVPQGLDALVTQFGRQVGARPVWIAASTHPDEEAQVVAIHRRLLARFPELLLLWAPRHPERFGRVAELAQAAGWRVGRRSAAGWPRAGDAVFVLDTLGELMGFYACAQVAFVGGSLQAIGGHNLLEPAAVGTAMVTGPHLHNFVEISRRLQEAGALEIGRNAEEVGTLLEALLADAPRRAQMAQAGRLLVERGRGALARTMAMVAPDLRPR
ncbi:lipid IV(A) 3-deoxy-D-manno-octulosonic acid transferase [Pseudoxanthomonas winnipegensis]|uniref:3-deoxy-D-manno-octulosonic acid transferase n=1 Tax=Pseudoxanthomonas winnipegensis TaxID=2480810 RepID=A0A4Q8LL83_9GAMM|nr:lipid IV(A) 3-deoxy-D-manno-octulosonic acid transferase [Pseudoxanthomonas winnipegensis]RZZ86152.1 3-deoxy-D-manno-octulosonic acid transferase [Pseudoxanthomonas winnipegensis]TAA31289.1 3-deoxy-D-manno-octulosonic acid transferase [Pseudoxanthomonas winnipegensis]TAA41167.1 3-deoxy-D-manno-octulosonic acid transferase [Pseudoxanthomonas winnipegensis]TBV77407.1 3-deoxy-D-manno-octulosonic acid transferase [Pseudoxanthomonas winnipegensis]